MAVATMRDLLEAGVHFGHRTPRWNPKMRPFIFGARGGIHIVDLQHTVRGLMTAQAFVRSLSADGGEIIFVGTKQQAQEVVREEADRCGAHYVVHRWLGGTLTNFDTLRTRVQRLRELQTRQQAGDFERMSKKAAHAHAIETSRLEKRMGGIRNLSRLPAALFIIDPKREAIAVKEARRLSIPIIALTDTNCDPDDVDYVIPGNDDSIRAVRAIAEQIANAVVAGRDATGDGVIEPGEDEAGELARATQNPVADLISLPFQNNTNFDFGPRDRVQNVLNIQPVLPFGITEDWNLITRTIVPISSQPSLFHGQDRETGLGDTTFTAFFSPKDSGKVTWGAGPVFLLPTASDDRLGADKWGLGPSLVVLTMPGNWVIGSLFSNVWSTGGSGDEDVNLFTWQYFVNYNLPNGWYLTSSPIITANWEADRGGDTWTFPIGGGFGKIIRLGSCR